MLTKNFTQLDYKDVAGRATHDFRDGGGRIASGSAVEDAKAEIYLFWRWYSHLPALLAFLFRLPFLGDYILDKGNTIP